MLVATLVFLILGGRVIPGYGKRGVDVVQQRNGDEELIAQYIVLPASGAGVERARLVPGGASIWSLITRLQHGDAEAVLAREYDVPLDAIHAARAYYARHQVEIDAQIALVNAAFTN